MKLGVSGLRLSVVAALALMTGFLGCGGEGTSGAKPSGEATKSSSEPSEESVPKDLPLHREARAGNLNLDLVKRLTATVDIDAQDEDGMTALHWAAEGGHMGTTQALIDGGANPAIADTRGKTALDYAEEGGHGGTAGVIRGAMGGGAPRNEAPREGGGAQESSGQTGRQGLNPSLKYPDLRSFEGAIGQAGCLLKSDHVWLFAPKTREAEANVVFPYLVKAYDELFKIVGVHTEYIIVVYNFSKGHRDAFGGTSNCVIYYDDENLDLTRHEEWNKHQVPHVSGYIEEMAHNFVGTTKAQFGWEMIGWSIGAMVTDKVAGNPIFARSLDETRRRQTDTFERYKQLGHVLPDDVAPNLVDRLHAYILWQCELAYGPTFWPDFFREVRKESAQLRDAVHESGDDAIRNRRYQITIECFERLPGIEFKDILRANGISLTTDVKSLHPTKPGWNRRLD